MWVIAADGVKTEISGQAITIGTPVIFAEDETYIYFTAHSKINQYNPTGILVTQLGVQAPLNCRHVCYIKGYLIADGADPVGTPIPGDVWYSSGTYATWNVFNNMARPDGILGLFATFKEIFAIGQETTEVSYATTDPANPFASNDAATQPFGTQSPYALAFDGQSLYFLTTIGGNRRICRLCYVHAIHIYY